MRARAFGNNYLKARVPASFAGAMQALQVRGAHCRSLQSVRDEEWRPLLSHLDEARLALPLAQQMYCGFPAWVDERLRKNLADTARHWDKVREAYREASATLDADGVEYLVMKGFTQAPDFLPRPELRRQSDIDLYVPHHQIAAAVIALKKIGYAPCQGEEYFRSADHVPTLVRFGDWKWGGNLYDPEVPPAIEVHYCFWNEALYSIAIEDVQDFWNRRIVRSSGGLVFPGLDLADHLGYFAMHILRDIFNGGAAVHHVRELGLFLDTRVGDDAFWRKWSTMHSPRFRSMQAIAFWLAVGWFSCGISDAVKMEIDSLPAPVRSWIRTCGCTPLESLFRRSRDGRVLQALLADTPEARKKIVWKGLLPYRIPSPATIAASETHPTIQATPHLIFRYLAYPGHLLRRLWLNGCAVLRFLANAHKVLSSSGRV